MSKKICIVIGCLVSVTCLAVMLWLINLAFPVNKEYMEGYEKGRRAPLSMACSVRAEIDRITTLQVLVGIPKEEAEASALLQLKNSILSDAGGKEDKAVGVYDGFVIRMKEC